MNNSTRSSSKSNTSSSNNKSRTGSSRQVIRKNGELFAISHKAPPAIKDKQPESERFSTTHAHYVAPPSNRSTGKKPLVSYHANSHRNRLPVKFATDPKTKSRYCAPRNITQFEIKDGSNVSAASRFRTSNRVQFCSDRQDQTGFSNSSIVANKTKFLHTRQLD